MPIGTHASRDFLNFISTQADKGKFRNLEMLMELERSCPRMFVKVMSNFEDVKSYRECLDKNGKPIKVSWEEALKKFYAKNKYIGITRENLDIAELFVSKGLSQEAFDEASSLREKAKASKIPEHILGKHVKEETILESIERIKSSIEVELSSGKK